MFLVMAEIVLLAGVPRAIAWKAELQVRHQNVLSVWCHQSEFRSLMSRRHAALATAFAATAAFVGCAHASTSRISRSTVAAVTVLPCSA